MDGMMKNFVLMGVLLILAILAYHFLTEAGVDLCFPFEGKNWCIN